MPYIFSISTISTVVLFVLVIFSAIMFWDCLKRRNSEFKNIFDFQDGKYDKILWLFTIIFSVKLFCIGAIAYFVFEKNKKK